MFYTFISMITKESVSLYTFFSSESRRLVRVFYQINFVPVDFQWISEINLQSSWSSNYWFISVLEVVVISRSSDSQYSWTFGLQGNIYERECVVSRCSWVQNKITKHFIYTYSFNLYMYLFKWLQCSKIWKAKPLKFYK